MSGNQGSDPDPGYAERARAEHRAVWARRKTEAARNNQNQTITTGHKARAPKGEMPV